MNPVDPVTSTRLTRSTLGVGPQRPTGDTSGKHRATTLGPMSYLLRVALPDVPGSLGRLASAIGTAGGNIDAIEIVERRDGRAVDDVFLAADAGVMPDSVISACNALAGVDVLWISRYAAGSNLTRDLEVVEAMTSAPDRARNTLVDLLPAAFVVDWALRARREGDGGKVLHGSQAAPDDVPEGMTWPGELERGRRIEVPDSLGDWLVAGCSLDDDELVVIARRGGPEILDSEIARLRHLAALAASIGS